MKTSCFDAELSLKPMRRLESFEALIIFRKSKIPCSFSFYQHFQKEKTTKFFVRIQSRDPLFLRWKDKFEVWKTGEKALLAEGKVLNPLPEKISQKKIKKRIAFLQRLQGNEKNMLLALIEERGMRGISEREISDFACLSREEPLRLSQELEEEGEVKILSFHPLFLLSKKSFDFLCKKIWGFLSYFHKKHPQEQGASLERIAKRFDLRAKILSLALNRLVKEHKIREFKGNVALFDFERELLPEEERILQKLEEMCFKEEFRSVSMEDLRQRFHLSSQKLNMMLSLLIERKKIIQGKAGFIIHYSWLDEIISKIQNSGKRELSVSDFKKMTGLSRKYAIPLLELLDQVGVTKRKGSLHQIM